MNLKLRYSFALFLLLALLSAFAIATIAVRAQDPAPAPASRPSPSPTATPSPTPTPVNWSSDPMLKRFVFRGIGPASMGGRIDDLAVVENNPYVIYVGFATGGLWKSTNNGTTFQPIFDNYSNASIGDVTVSQTDPNIVWVGTGEPNNRQSSTYGDGIYKSTDAGKTFTRMGLTDSQTIARIVIDPKDVNIVYVAVVGHLFGPNKERGIYKTIDGGKTWNNIKFINEDTGFTDIVIDPNDNKTLYAASYQRRRTSWGFNGGGPGSGLWKTTDAGKTWNKLEGNGLPEGLLGRIGLDCGPVESEHRLRANRGGRQPGHRRRGTGYWRTGDSDAQSVTLAFRCARCFAICKPRGFANARATQSEKVRRVAL